MALIAAAQIFETANDLRGSTGVPNVQVLVNGLSTVGDGFGGAFMWDATSTIPDDSIGVIAVTGVPTGRWIRMKNSNVLKASVTFSAISLTTNYTITHGLGFVPAMIVLTPTSLNASGLCYISAKTTTTFTVSFITVPVVGTNNISFDYLIIKT